MKSNQVLQCMSPWISPQHQLPRMTTAAAMIIVVLKTVAFICVLSSLLSSALMLVLPVAHALPCGLAFYNNDHLRNQFRCYPVQVDASICTIIANECEVGQSFIISTNHMHCSGQNLGIGIYNGDGPSSIFDLPKDAIMSTGCNSGRNICPCPGAQGPTFSVCVWNGDIFRGTTVSGFWATQECTTQDICQRAGSGYCAVTDGLCKSCPDAEPACVPAGDVCPTANPCRSKTDQQSCTAASTSCAWCAYNSSCYNASLGENCPSPPPPPPPPAQQCADHLQEAACSSSSDSNGPCKWCGFTDSCLSQSAPCTCAAISNGESFCKSKSGCVWCQSTEKCNDQQQAATCQQCDSFDGSSDKCATLAGCDWDAKSNSCYNRGSQPPSPHPHGGNTTPAWLQFPLLLGTIVAPAVVLVCVIVVVVVIIVIKRRRGRSRLQSALPAQMNYGASSAGDTSLLLPGSSSTAATGKSTSVNYAGGGGGGGHEERYH